MQALRYQGEQAAEIEAELRWQVHPRLSLVGVGVGRARGDGAQSERGQNVRAAGAGYRFLVPRKHGLHMGLDVAAGADDPALYVVFGSAWLRP